MLAHLKKVFAMLAFFSFSKDSQNHDQHLQRQNSPWSNSVTSILRFCPKGVMCPSFLFSSRAALMMMVNIKMVSSCTSSLGSAPSSSHSCRSWQSCCRWWGWARRPRAPRRWRTSSQQPGQNTDHPLHMLYTSITLNIWISNCSKFRIRTSIPTYLEQFLTILGLN